MRAVRLGAAALMLPTAAIASAQQAGHFGAPDVEILDFNERGTVLAVRPYCHTDHYWQVNFDTNKLIAKTFGEAGYAAPIVIEQQKQHSAS
jgi:small conductance mechanosensitive channel